MVLELMDKLGAHIWRSTLGKASQVISEHKHARAVDQRACIDEWDTDV